MQSLLDKDPHEVIYRAVKGMVPKNKLREDILKQHLIVHDGPYHSQFEMMLPQFTESDAININDHFDLSQETVGDKEKWEIVFATDEQNIPEELKDLDVNINPDQNKPETLREKTHTMPKDNMFMAQGLKN